MPGGTIADPSKRPDGLPREICDNTKTGPGFVVTFHPPSNPFDCPKLQNDGRVTSYGVLKQCEALSLSSENTERCKICCDPAVTDQDVRKSAGKINSFSF